MATPKQIEDKVERILTAWRTLAPDKSFGGMTLAQFEAAAAPSKAARQHINELNDQLTEAMATRDEADASILAKAQLVVAGVLADPTEGPDSPLYATFGYTRKSERKTGLTRKRNQPPKP
jgi:crotonobetainyl-CoA:carnitine CoA-transferase CaiB-like acyl-CoA transferase